MWRSRLRFSFVPDLQRQGTDGQPDAPVVTGKAHRISQVYQQEGEKI